MTLKDRILAFSKLGDFLSDFLKDDYSFDENDTKSNEDKLNKAIEESEIINPWFTKENILLSLKNTARQLTGKNINNWLEKYNLPEKNNNPKKIGVIMAGNIPLVGFHDFISVLITGNIFVGKLSSKDDLLLKCISDIICEILPSFKQNIIFEENILKGFDAVIATGSNNSSMYFEFYFKNIPHIIRKNRNSVAVLDGNETNEELYDLGKDIFSYFGLGCRNISKIYIPDNYVIKNVFDVFENFKEIINHNKYFNNYSYNQTLYLMKRIEFLDNGFVILVEETNISSPISVLHYEYYKNIRKLYEVLESNSSQIQCVATNMEGFGNSVKLGNTQKTELWDYADNVDTIKFLNSIN